MLQLIKNLFIILSCGLNNQEKLYSYLSLNILSQLVCVVGSSEYLKLNFKCKGLKV